MHSYALHVWYSSTHCKRTFQPQGSWLSYLYNGDPYTSKMTSLFWHNPLFHFQMISVWYAPLVWHVYELYFSCVSMQSFFSSIFTNGWNCRLCYFCTLLYDLISYKFVTSCAVINRSWKPATKMSQHFFMCYRFSKIDIWNNSSTLTMHSNWNRSV